jgi:hypothetical protein
VASEQFEALWRRGELWETEEAIRAARAVPHEATAPK